MIRICLLCYVGINLKIKTYIAKIELNPIPQIMVRHTYPFRSPATCYLPDCTQMTGMATVAVVGVAAVAVAKLKKIEHQMGAQIKMKCGKS